MGARRTADRCEDCTANPVMWCGRCARSRCEAHELPAGVRCDHCEHDFLDDAPTRRAAKLIFVPPITVFAGGLLFGLLLPVTILGAFGAAIMCAIACGTAAIVATGACRVVDRSARALFLRERAGQLPPARLLPSPRHR